MSDTPRTDNAVCARRWTEWQGEFELEECEQLYVEPEFTRELERELVAAKADAESWANQADDRVKDCVEQINRAEKAERDLARVTAERDAEICVAESTKWEKDGTQEPMGRICSLAILEDAGL